MVSRGATSKGVLATVIVVTIFAFAGCGGGSSSPAGSSHSLAKLRSQIRPIMNTRLTKFGASPSQIACVDRVIETSTATEIGRRLTQGDVERPQRKKTPKQVAGALAGDCF